MTADELKYKRMRYRLTQQDLGVLLGYPEKYARMRVYKYESGGAAISAPTAVALGFIFKDAQVKEDLEKVKK